MHEPAGSSVPPRLTISGALARGVGQLTAAGTPAADLDALVLLQWATNIPATRIRAMPDTELSVAQLELYEDWIARRAAGEPVAYVTGHKAFMGLDLLVDQRVLIVRPLTQVIAEVALELARVRATSSIRAADIGTGSGALAIALAVLEPRFELIYATDVSPHALDVARTNVARYRLDGRVVLRQGDLLAALPEPVDLIVANLPYVPEAAISTSPSFEPAVAIYGGSDGLRLLRRFCDQLPHALRSGGAVVLETGPGQRETVNAAVIEALPNLVVQPVPASDDVILAELPT